MNAIQKIARTVVSAMDAFLAMLAPVHREPARVKVEQHTAKRYKARNL